MENLHLWSLLTVFVFALLNEAIIEYMFGSVVPLKAYLPLLALASAIILVLIYQINVLSLLLGIQSSSPFLDFLLSAFIIARLSNFINDFVRRVLGSK